MALIQNTTRTPRAFQQFDLRQDIRAFPGRVFEFRSTLPKLEEEHGRLSR